MVVHLTYKVRLVHTVEEARHWVGKLECYWLSRDYNDNFYCRPHLYTFKCVNFLAPEIPRNRRAKPTAPYLLEECSGMSLVVMFDRFQIVHMMRR